MRRGFAWFALALPGLLPFGGAGAQPAAPDPALYRCHVIVTGTDARERPAGLARCVAEVLAKVSGDPALADDPRVAAIGQRAGGLVEDLAYLDRMSDIPVHDEQGSRDRPFDLIAHLDPARVDAELAGLGVAPWTAPRPTLLVVATVRRGNLSFTLSADGGHGERQRQALLAAAERFGMRVALPTDADLAAGALPGASGAGRRAVRLDGSLRWSEADLGWVAEWTLPRDGARSWTVRGVSFDEAFRAGVGGAARALSGRG